MDTIKNIIDRVKKAQSEKKAITPIVLTASEAVWRVAKSKVNNLSANFDQVAKENKSLTRVRNIQNGNVLEVGLPPVDGFECNLYVARNNNDITQTARYELWDENRVYIRDLLNESLRIQI